MFDLGWQEFMLIALIALIVVGPKDLPRVIRAVSQGIRRVRGVAREFHSSLEEVAREAELDDIRKQARDLANEGLDESLRKDLDPMGEIEHSIRDAQRQFNDANSAIGAAERSLNPTSPRRRNRPLTPSASLPPQSSPPRAVRPRARPAARSRTGPRADQRSCRGRWRGGAPRRHRDRRSGGQQDAVARPSGRAAPTLALSFVGFIVAFFVCYGVAEYIFQFLVRPLADLTEGQENRRMIYTALHEAFFTYIKVAFFAAACISFPMFAVQIWKFVAPGLYKNEQRAFLPFLIATPVLFALGAAMVYFLVIPLAWQFFLSFETTADAANMAMELEPKVDQYLSLVMRLIFAFGVSFELPVLIVLMAQVGLVSTEGLRQKRKYAIVIAFVAAAILTPPDVISQVLLAVPIILLYEISIVCAGMIERRRARAEDMDADPA